MLTRNKDQEKWPPDTEFHMIAERLGITTERRKKPELIVFIFSFDPNENAIGKKIRKCHLLIFIIDTVFEADIF